MVEKNFNNNIKLQNKYYYGISLQSPVSTVISVLMLNNFWFLDRDMYVYRLNGPVEINFPINASEMLFKSERNSKKSNIFF